MSQIALAKPRMISTYDALDTVRCADQSWSCHDVSGFPGLGEAMDGRLSCGLALCFTSEIALGYILDNMAEESQDTAD